MTSSVGPRFVYVADVMCSWCWGFAPVLDQLRDRFQMTAWIVNGGLRPGPHAQELDPQMVAYLTGTWQKVQEATGQPFDPSWLEQRSGWKFDSELPAIAVALMRAHAPQSTLPFFYRLQKAFYAQGVDITEPAEYPHLVDGFPVEAESFVAQLVTPEAQKAAWDDFQQARSLGVFGFPTLLLDTGSDQQVVTRGYQPFPQLEERVKSLLPDPPPLSPKIISPR